MIRLRHYFGSHPDRLSEVRRDADAFEGTPLGLGVIGLLERTGLFDAVEMAWDPRDVPSPAGLDVTALVTPRPASRLDSGSSSLALRVVDYDLLITVSGGEDADAWGRLDEIEAACVVALLSRDTRSYGGFCVPWMSRLVRDNTRIGTNPRRSRLLSGRFAYETNLGAP